MVDPLILVNLFKHAPCWINIIVNKLRKLCIPASNLRHSLMNGVFSVLFKKRCQSVLCVISVFFVCLFVLIYTVSQKVLKVHFWRRFSKVVFSTGNSTMELIVCLSFLKRPKTDSLCKYKIRLSWIPYSVEELFYFRQQFSELHEHYTTHRITRCQKPITCSCRCEFPQGRKFQ